MERVHYRRYTASKLHSSLPAPERVGERNAYRERYMVNQHAGLAKMAKEAEVADSGGFREKFIVQGIICGIIFAVVLLINMTENAWALDLRASLSEAITYHVRAEQVASEVRRILGDGSALGGQNMYTETEQERTRQMLENEGQDPQDVLAPYDPAALPSPSGRIDEDVLREIIGGTEGEDIQTTAPEPILMPEL